jgi:hypothetical protein
VDIGVIWPGCSNEGRKFLKRERPQPIGSETEWKRTVATDNPSRMSWRFPRAFLPTRTKNSHTQSMMYTDAWMLVSPANESTGTTFGTKMKDQNFGSRLWTHRLFGLFRINSPDTRINFGRTPPPLPISCLRELVAAEHHPKHLVVVVFAIYQFSNVGPACSYTLSIFQSSLSFLYQ